MKYLVSLFLVTFLLTPNQTFGNESIYSLLENGKYAEALQQADSAISELPKNTPPTSPETYELFALKARSTLELGEFESAVNQLRVLAAVEDSGPVPTADCDLLVDVLVDLGRAHQSIYEGNEARQAFTRAQRLLSEENRTTPLCRARYCYHLAEFISDYDAYQEAAPGRVEQEDRDPLQYAEEALNIRREISGPDDWKTIQAQALVGMLQALAGEKSLAVVNCFTALSMAKEEMPLEHPFLAQLYADVAAINALFTDQGLRRQELNQLRCLLIETEAYEETHPYYINNFIIIGDTKCEQGNYREAKKWFEKGIAILRKKKISRDVAYSLQEHLRSLAKANAASDEYTKAFGQLDEAEALVSRHFGENTVLLVRILAERGEYLLNSGDAVEAKRVYQKATEKLLAIRPEGHEFVGDLNYGTARSFYQRGDVKNAISFHLRALAETKRHTGASSFATALRYRGLGLLMREAKNLEEAMAAYQAALDILTDEFDESSREARDARIDLAAVAIQMSNFGKAKRLLEQQVQIDRRKFGDNHETTVESKATLGWLLLRKFDDARTAEVLFEQAAEFYESEFQDSETKEQLRNVLQGLELSLRARAKAAGTRAKSLEPTNATPNNVTS